MAILTLEDYSSKMEILVFPKVYRNFVRLLYEENTIAVEGRMNINEREIAVNALKVLPLNADGFEVRLRIEPQLENQLVQRQLMRIFQKYQGNDVVYLHLLGSNKVIKTTPNFWVNSSADGFKEDLQKILGANCFISRE